MWQHWEMRIETYGLILGGRYQKHFSLSGTHGGLLEGGTLLRARSMATGGCSAFYTPAASTH